MLEFHEHPIGIFPIRYFFNPCTVPKNTETSRGSSSWNCLPSTVVPKMKTTLEKGIFLQFCLLDEKDIWVFLPYKTLHYFFFYFTTQPSIVPGEYLHYLLLEEFRTPLYPYPWFLVTLGFFPRSFSNVYWLTCSFSLYISCSHFSREVFCPLVDLRTVFCDSNISSSSSVPSESWSSVSRVASLFFGTFYEGDISIGLVGVVFFWQIFFPWFHLLSFFLFET